MIDRKVLLGKPCYGYQQEKYGYISSNVLHSEGKLILCSSQVYV